MSPAYNGELVACINGALKKGDMRAAALLHVGFLLGQVQAKQFSWEASQTMLQKLYLQLCASPKAKPLVQAAMDACVWLPEMGGTRVFTSMGIPRRLVPAAYMVVYNAALGCRPTSSMRSLVHRLEACGVSRTRLVHAAMRAILNIAVGCGDGDDGHGGFIHMQQPAMQAMLQWLCSMQPGMPAAQTPRTDSEPKSAPNLSMHKPC